MPSAITRSRRNFRACFGNGGEQRGLAGVWVTDQADFGHDAQFEEVIAFASGLARLCETRRLADGRGEVAVAQAAASAFAKNELLAVLRQIGDEFAAFVSGLASGRLLGLIFQIDLQGAFGAGISQNAF